MLGISLNSAVVVFTISKMVFTSSLFDSKNSSRTAITKQGHGLGQLPMRL